MRHCFCSLPAKERGYATDVLQFKKNAMAFFFVEILQVNPDPSILSGLPLTRSLIPVTTKLMLIVILKL